MCFDLKLSMKSTREFGMLFGKLFSMIFDMQLGHESFMINAMICRQIKCEKMKNLLEGR